METWSNPGPSVTPEANIFKDREVEYIHAINGLGDNTKDIN